MASSLTSELMDWVKVYVGGGPDIRWGGGAEVVVVVGGSAGGSLVVSLGERERKVDGMRVVVFSDVDNLCE